MKLLRLLKAAWDWFFAIDLCEICSAPACGLYVFMQPHPTAEGTTLTREGPVRKLCPTCLEEFMNDPLYRDG